MFWLACLANVLSKTLFLMILYIKQQTKESKTLQQFYQAAIHFTLGNKRIKAIIHVRRKYVRNNDDNEEEDARKNR